MEKIYEFIIYFIFFSIGGWLCETIYCTIVDKKLAYRGFLNGPICPIYGFGGTMVVYLLVPFQNNIFILFIMGAISATILEYFTHYLLEKLFHTKWWDYTTYPLNINGRVCLPYSLMFGVLSIFAVYIIYPPFSDLVEKIPYNIKPALASILLLGFISDCAFTLSILFKFNGTLVAVKKNREKMLSTIEEMNKKGANAKEKLTAYKEGHLHLDELIKTARTNATPSDLEILEKLYDKHERFKIIGKVTKTQINRLSKAFSNMKRTKYHIEASEIKAKNSQKENHL